MKKHRYKLITTGILFTTATAIIHFMNHLISTTAIMKDLLKSTASNYYNWRFGKIYYTKQGTGFSRFINSRFNCLQFRL